MSAAISGIGTATPEPVSQEQLWDEFFSHHFRGRRGAGTLFRRSGVEHRGGCVSPMEEDVRDWPTSRRMERFVEEAVPLAARALDECLLRAGLPPSEVDLLTVVSCTGYATPGLDVRLPAKLGMSEHLERLHVGHMGCFAAIPGLAATSDAATARGRNAVLVCVELPSLHLQPFSADSSHLVAHALFADAAAAVAVTPGAQGLALVDVHATTMADEAAHMTWDVTEQGFRMGLSPRVPSVLEAHVAGAVDTLLGRHDLTVGDVTGWAVHPGGPRIVDVVADQLGLDSALDASRHVLASTGNTSSATVLLVLDRLLATTTIGRGDHVVCLAFGPGLTLYAALLRQV